MAKQNPAKALLQSMKKQQTQTNNVILWDIIAADFKVNYSWELTARAQGLSVKELEEAFAEWEFRPDNVKNLKQWAPMLQAQARTEYLRDLQKVAGCGSRAAQNLYVEERDGTRVDLRLLLPKCCPAAQMFRGNFSVEEARLALGKEHPIRCDHPEDCRARAMLVEKMSIRDMQSVLIANGNTKMLTFAAENILHQGTGGEAEFDPAHCDFIIQGEE